MSRETVAWTASIPSARRASASSAWVERCRCSTSFRIAPCRSSGSSSQYLAQPVDCEVGLLVRDRERRREAERGVAGRPDEQVVLERRVRDRPGGPAELDREQQPGAAGAVDPGLAAGAPISRTWARRSSSIVSTTAQAAAQLHGVAAEGRGVVAGHEAGRRVVGDEQRADREPVREPLRERDRVGPDPARCQAKNSPVRPTPVCTSSKTSSASLSSASCARLLERLRSRAAARRPRPAPARARSRRVRARRRRRASRGSRTARPGTSGSNGARFAGWPVIESAPIVRPWNEPSSATSSGLPGRLARPLDRGLDRLGAGVAEERVGAAEPLGEQPGEVLHRLGRVEVRHVPEPLELLAARPRAAPDGSGRG